MVGVLVIGDCGDVAVFGAVVVSWWCCGDWGCVGDDYGRPREWCLVLWLCRGGAVVIGDVLVSEWWCCGDTGVAFGGVVVILAWCLVVLW